MKTKGEKDAFRKSFFGEDDPNRWDSQIVNDKRVIEFVETLSEGDYKLNRPERTILEFAQGACTQEDCTKALTEWRSWNHSNKFYERGNAEGGRKVRVKEDDLLKVADEKTRGTVEKINAQIEKLALQKKDLLESLRTKAEESRKVETQEKKAMTALQKLLASGISLDKIKEMLNA